MTTSSDPWSTPVVAWLPRTGVFFRFKFYNAIENSGRSPRQSCLTHEGMNIALVEGVAWRWKETGPEGRKKHCVFEPFSIIHYFASIIYFLDSSSIDTPTYTLFRSQFSLLGSLVSTSFLSTKKIHTHPKVVGRVWLGGHMGMHILMFFGGKREKEQF